MKTHEALDELKDKALRLSDDDRAELLETLAASFEASEMPGLQMAGNWKEVILERMRKLDAGETQGIPAEEVRRRLKERFGR